LAAGFAITSSMRLSPVPVGKGCGGGAVDFDHDPAAADLQFLSDRNSAQRSA
jgi:hypothetical protein